MEVEDIQAFKEVYRPLNQGMWKDLEKGLITKNELINTRFSRTFAHFGRQVDGTEMALRYQEFIGQQGQIFAGADKLLQELTERGYQIYRRPTVWPIFRKIACCTHPFNLISKKYLFQNRWGRKAFGGFLWKIAEQIAGFQIEQALMIGDSLTADIQGGNNAGMDTVWYNPSNLINNSKAVPTYTIHNYQELLEML